MTDRPSDGRSRPGTTPARKGPLVLVVDDERNIADMVAAALRFHGHEVLTAYSGQAALEQFLAHQPDLVVLDIMMPGITGTEVCARIREAQSDTGVIFLTAKTDLPDRIAGLSMGADDYLAKPFAIGELIARVNAVLRRTRPGTSPSDSELITFCDVELDEKLHIARRAGQEMELSPTEYRLLRYFALNPNVVLSRQQILNAVWDYGFHGSPTIVDQYVRYLRPKLNVLGPPLLRTHRGLGYAMREPK